MSRHSIPARLAKKRSAHIIDFLIHQKDLLLFGFDAIQKMAQKQLFMKRRSYLGDKYGILRVLVGLIFTA